MSNKETKQENKKWFVNSDGDITDGECLIAEPNYLTNAGYKNAHLMAAAPELFEVLVYIIEQGDFPQLGFSEHRVNDRAVAALNKARGV
jgi:hypothetical protein